MRKSHSIEVETTAPCPPAIKEMLFSLGWTERFINQFQKIDPWGYDEFSWVEALVLEFSHFVTLNNVGEIKS